MHISCQPLSPISYPFLPGNRFCPEERQEEETHKEWNINSLGARDLVRSPAPHFIVGNGEIVKAIDVEEFFPLSCDKWNVWLSDTSVLKLRDTILKKEKAADILEEINMKALPPFYLTR